MTNRLKKSALYIGMSTLVLWVIPIAGIVVAVLGIFASKEAYQDHEVLARTLSYIGLAAALINSFFQVGSVALYLILGIIAM